MKTRNPIANAAKKIRPQTVPDKRRAARAKALDELAAEAQRLGLYDNHYVYMREGD